jgi:hypothetical protein
VLCNFLIAAQSTLMVLDYDPLHVTHLPLAYYATAPVKQLSTEDRVKKLSNHKEVRLLQHWWAGVGRLRVVEAGRLTRGECYGRLLGPGPACMGGTHQLHICCRAAFCGAAVHVAVVQGAQPQKQRVQHMLSMLSMHVQSFSFPWVVCITALLSTHTHSAPPCTVVSCSLPPHRAWAAGGLCAA